jgi:hypothetical protein
MGQSREVQKTNWWYKSSFMRIIILLILICISFNCKISPDKFQIMPIKIRVLDKETKQPVHNIKIYHIFSYNSYEGWANFESNKKHVVLNEYFTNHNGEIVIPESTVWIKKLSESSYSIGDILLINVDTQEKKVDESISILTVERNISFNKLYTQYYLDWWYFKNFNRINSKYKGYFYEFDDMPYNEKELNQEYSKYDIEYHLISKKQRDTQYIEIEIK